MCMAGADSRSDETPSQPAWQSKDACQASGCPGPSDGTIKYSTRLPNNGSQVAACPHGGGGWYVYILRCADGTLYTGVTTDPARRLREHNAGGKLGARYTRARRPVALIHQEPAASRAEACRREAAIKRMNREAKHALAGSP